MITKYNEELEEVQSINEELISEELQIGDTVKLDNQKGYIIGQTGDGDLIIQVQGSTHKVSPKSKKLKGEKQEPLETTPHMKFDKVSLKLLFEQYVRCGVFHGNTPLVVNNCYTKFSDWNDAKDDQPINVLIEGTSNIMPKNLVRIFEDVNDFANPDVYVDGVVVDEETEEPVEIDIKVNAVDYVNAFGDSDMVRIIRSGDNEKTDNQEIDQMPKGKIRIPAI